MLRLTWSRLALLDREAIFHRITADNAHAALAVDARIQNHAKLLVAFPLLGRPGRLRDTRELVIAGTPYIAHYRLSENVIRVLRLVHGARNWPP